MGLAVFAGLATTVPDSLQLMIRYDLDVIRYDVWPLATSACRVLRARDLISVIKFATASNLVHYGSTFSTSGFFVFFFSWLAHWMSMFHFGNSQMRKRLTTK